MITLLRRKAGEDVLMTVEDGFAGATVHLSAYDLVSLQGALGVLIRRPEPGTIGVETHGEIAVDVPPEAP